MPETNETNQKPLPKQELCTIRIVFPVESDEQAIGFKKKIDTLLVDIPDSVIQFSIMSKPAGGRINAGMAGL